MLHPQTKLGFINDVIGHGVVATHFIPKGTVTWVLDDLDMEFPPEEVDRMYQEKSATSILIITEGTERKAVRPHDRLNFHDEWDEN
jgi:hypothetical protein